MERSRSRNQSNVSERITDFYDCMVDGSYEDFFPDYEAYVTRQVLRVKRFYKGGAVLSVGCGNGDIEARLPMPVVCYDIHDAAKYLHPELDFRYDWPDKKFELVLCIQGRFCKCDRKSHEIRQYAMNGYLRLSVASFSKDIFSSPG